MLPRTRPRLCGLLLLAVVLCGGGCVRRMIHITSDPSGALVHLNDEEVGRTPLSVPFTFYGTYDVRLQHEGYRPVWTSAEAELPWWEYPGPDLVAEAIPGTKSDVRWHFRMEPAEPAEPEAVIDRARQLRATLRQP